MSVVLPTPENNSGPNDWSDVYSNDAALAAYVETLQKEVAAKTGFTWYTPKVIATEQTRENTAYGTLTTADEIKEVVLPENGLLLVGYQASWKQSGVVKGRAAIFLNNEQLKKAETGNNAPVVSEAAPEQSNVFSPLSTYPLGLASVYASGTYSGDVTTGQTLGSFGVSAYYGGMCPVFAAAGTYDISIKFKASEGSVTAKERKLWCCVLG